MNNLYKSCMIFMLTLGMTACASVDGDGRDDYSTLNGGDHVQEVRPDVFFIISKSGYYVPDEAPLMLIDKLISKAVGQGPATAKQRWEMRAAATCGADGYRTFKVETFSHSANTGPYPRWIATHAAYAVCNRKQYSDADIKALFPDW